MNAIGLAALIFCLRITDVSIGTIRVIYTVRGHRVVAMTLGFFESLVWIYAISRLFEAVQHSHIGMVAWAIGFSTGTALGITLEKWIATGEILVRIISVHRSDELLSRLREIGFGVTAVPGEGRDGPILVLFVLALRRRGNEILAAVQSIDPDAFITIEPIAHAIGGHLPHATSPQSVKK